MFSQELASVIPDRSVQKQEPKLAFDGQREWGNRETMYALRHFDDDRVACLRRGNKQSRHQYRPTRRRRSRYTGAKTGTHNPLRPYLCAWSKSRPRRPASKERDRFVNYTNGGTHGWFVVERVEIFRRYNGPQPPRHTFYVLLDLHIRVLRVRMGDRHEDLILGRRRCLGTLRHGWLLTNLLWVGTGC